MDSGWGRGIVGVGRGIVGGGRGIVGGVVDSGWG